MHRLRWDLVVSFEGVIFVINGPQFYLMRGMKNSPWHFENYTQSLLQLFFGGKYWSTKHIKFYCDNLGTVQIIRKGRSKVNYINKLMRRLTWCSVKYNFCIYAEHLPGKSNVIANALSRFQMQHFRRLVPHADKQPLQCPSLSQVMWKFEEEFAN